MHKIRGSRGFAHREFIDGHRQSALREFGNILASHVVSPMADALGVAILPSIPVLAMEGAPQALASLLSLRGSDAPVLRIETEISDRERSLHGLLVFVPAEVQRIAPAAGF